MKIETNKLVSDKINLKFLEKFAKKVFKLVKLNIPELSIAIVNDARMKALNKKYRHKNKITDVLAFDYGEIIICLNQTKRQAKTLGLSTEQELATLLIHGILHLSGYNDETEQDFNIMNKQQNKILKEVWQEIKL
jgi:rRNA maturation RNase YbeY